MKLFGLILSVLSLLAFGFVQWADGLLHAPPPQSFPATWGHTAPLVVLGIFLILGGPRELTAKTCAVFVALTLLVLVPAEPWAPFWIGIGRSSLTLVCALALFPMIYGLWAAKVDLTDWRDNPQAPKHDHRD